MKKRKQFNYKRSKTGRDKMDKVTLVFNVANYNTMMEGLASLPYKVSSPVIQEIMNQVNAQMPKMGSQLAAVPQEAKEG